MLARILLAESSSAYRRDSACSDAGGAPDGMFDPPPETLAVPGGYLILWSNISTGWIATLIYTIPRHIDRTE